jgi:formylglycine-generating enzyme required for sulfatase activity
MIRFLAYILVLICVALWPHREGQCSNLKITNPTLGTLSGGSTTVSFDVTWTNSWRFTDPGAPAPNNWDAAWVFVKFRKNGGNWEHASLNDNGHSMGTGTAATYSVGYPDTNSSFNIATNPGVGVFLYRSGDGSGTFSLTGAGLSWNYAQDGVATNDTVEIRVFGIEMVYVPDGSFFAGGAGGTRSFKQGSSDTDPWYIGSEDAITTGGQTGSGTGVGETNAEYYYTKNPSATWEDATGGTFEIPATFPKGYRRFYVMKGEISQGQWVAFFNTLTSTQKTTRDITSATGKNTDTILFRNNVSWSGTGDATLPDQGSGATYSAVAMNYISLGDQEAYLDWAGLRLMTDFEFERAARGPYRVVSAEYAWGNTTITAPTSISTPGTDTEAAQSAANCVYGNHVDIQGPMRVGAMAYNHATRTTSGAGYYGVMDLSGNLQERVLNVGVSAARVVESRYHGNGSLLSTGEADVTNWPSPGGSATGVRGGGWTTTTVSQLSTQDRSAISLGSSRNRHNAYGGRGVRTAP